MLKQLTFALSNPQNSHSLEPQPPAVPSSLSVNSSITYAIITWAEPSEEEEADFEGYILSYGSTIPDEFDVTIEPTETFYNLTGLTPDTEYIVYLRSFNGLTDSVPISVFFRTQSKPIDGKTAYFAVCKHVKR